MKKSILVLLMAVCLLVATQVSADIYAVSNDSDELWIMTETKIVSQEDVVIYRVDDERIADFTVCSKPAASGFNFRIIPDSGFELEMIFDYSVKHKRIKPESIPFMKGL